jgi:hypothetical protein
LCIGFDFKCVGLHFGRFFTNSSGYAERWLFISEGIVLMTQFSNISSKIIVFNKEFKNKFIFRNIMGG